MMALGEMPWKWEGELSWSGSSVWGGAKVISETEGRREGADSLKKGCSVPGR